MNDMSTFLPPAGPAPRLDALEPVARAIDFLTVNSELQPSLEQTAAHVGLSPAHFQRMFKAGAGVSPKRFLRFRGDTCINSSNWKR